jgi:hypothetical protein
MKWIVNTKSYCEYCYPEYLYIRICLCGYRKFEVRPPIMKPNSLNIGRHLPDFFSVDNDRKYDFIEIAVMLLKCICHHSSHHSSHHRLYNLYRNKDFTFPKVYSTNLYPDKYKLYTVYLCECLLNRS